MLIVEFTMERCGISQVPNDPSLISGVLESTVVFILYLFPISDI